MRFRRIAILFSGLLAGALCGASPTVLDLTTAAGAVKVEGNIGSCPRNGRLELTVPAASGLYAEKGLFPNIRFAPRNGKYFDFSEAGVLAAEVENLSPYPIDIVLEIQGELPDGRKALSKSGIALNAGEKSVLRHRFSPVVNTSFAPGGVFDPFPGFPNPRRPDPARITRIVLMCRRPMREFRFAVSPFVAEAPPERPAAALASPAAFYPCIDRFGQYRHPLPPQQRAQDLPRRLVQRDAQGQKGHVLDGQAGDDQPLPSLLQRHGSLIPRPPGAAEAGAAGTAAVGTRLTAKSSPCRPSGSRRRWPRRSRYAPPWKTWGTPALPSVRRPEAGW